MHARVGVRLANDHRVENLYKVVVRVPLRRPHKVELNANVVAGDCAVTEVEIRDSISGVNPHVGVLPGLGPLQLAALAQSLDLAVNNPSHNGQNV